MEHIILVGAGGCMRELVWQIQELNKKFPAWQIDGYADARIPAESEVCIVGSERISFLGTDEMLLLEQKPVNVAICVGSPRLRKKIAEKLMQNPNLKFPNLILGNVEICEDLRIGKGCIISMDVRISTNVKIGDFVFLNTGSKVCHDGCIEDFVTLGPDVTLAGNVRVGSASEIGLGAKVIQGITIGERTIIGASSVVVRDIEADCTAVGVPARKKREKQI